MARIREQLKSDGFLRSRQTIYNIINGNGKKRESKLNGSEWKYQRERKVLTPEVLNTIKRKFDSKNPPTFRGLSNRLKIPKSTISDGVIKCLNKKKRMKTKVHILTPKDIKNRKTNARKLYENFLSGKKSRFVVTLDEAYIHVRQDGKETRHYYVDNDMILNENVPIPVNENFPEQFMIVGAMTEERTFPLIRVPSKTKCNAHYYVDFVLRPLIEKHLKPYFGDDLNQVTIHHDKATSHTAKYTTDFLMEMKERYGISFITKKDIPVKGCDISPMDFFGFAYLKQAIGKSRAKTSEGIWKKCKSVWNNVPTDYCKNTFKAWKRRCLKVKDKKGGHIEHSKNIHSLKIKPLSNK